MPNFRQPNKGKGGKKNKPKQSNKAGFKRPPTGAGVSWGSTAPPKEEQTYTQKNFWYIVAGIVFLFLFCLWAFVEDSQTIERQKAAQKAARQRANVTQTETPRKEFAFEYANLYNTSQFTETMRKYQDEEEDDRIIVVAFDDSTREAEGSPTKVRLFRKYESIAKSMPRKSIFKRYEEEELPLIIIFDCGNPEDKAAEGLCKQIVGENIPNVVIFRPNQQPRALPNDYRSDNQIITYLYNLMQPAVRYLEERADCEDFVANDEMMNVVLFGDEKTGSYDQVADSLREFARFGKTRNPAAAEEFDTEMNTILIWKTFGQNPNRFVGNISDLNAVYSYVLNNYLPIFGEFTPVTSNRYMKRGLPIVWIAYDRNSDSSKGVLEIAETMAHRYVGMMSFVQLDAKSYPQIANNFGIDLSSSDEDEKDRDEDDEEEDEEERKNTDEEDDTNSLPQVFIMNQMAQIREIIDSNNVEESINKVCEEYMRLVRAARGEGLTELDTSDYDGDEEEDDEFEEDDEEEDEDINNVQLGEDYDEDEEDAMDDEEEDVAAPGPPKQDL